MIFPAQLSALKEMLQWVGLQASKIPFSRDSLKKIELALEELLANIIFYAYTHQKGEIQLFSQIEGNKIQFIIKDKGKPFNPLLHLVAPPSNDSHLEKRTVGGLGIFLAHQLMDRMEYRREGEWNVLLVEKSWISDLK
jgi:anti-sigma regulatory factor (Ser/Thr protein kinase)